MPDILLAALSPVLLIASCRSSGASYGGVLSFVGPRPVLFNQDDLIALRTQYGVDKLVPSLTSWAQINGRDDLSIPAKVKLDKAFVRREGVHH